MYEHNSPQKKNNSCNKVLDYPNSSQEFSKIQFVLFVSLRNVQQPQVTNIRPNWSAAVHRTLSFFSTDAYIVIVTVIAVVIVGGVNGPRCACCMQTSRWITTVRRHINVTDLSVVRHNHCQEVKKRAPTIKWHRHSSPVFIILSKFLYICFNTAYFSYYSFFPQQREQSPKNQPSTLHPNTV